MGIAARNREIMMILGLDHPGIDGELAADAARVTDVGDATEEIGLVLLGERPDQGSIGVDARWQIV